jgi:hypothetical protein
MPITMRPDGVASTTGHDDRMGSGTEQPARKDGRRLTPRAQSLVALGAFSLLSLLVFGRKVLLDPSGSTVGFATDPGVFAWHFTWWPHAIAHGLDPLVTDLVWAPVGSNLAQATGVPSAASSVVYPMAHRDGFLLGPAHPRPRPGAEGVPGRQRRERHRRRSTGPPGHGRSCSLRWGFAPSRPAAS